MDVELELPTRALTLWQPWAWLLAQGIKTIENRSAGFSHKSFRGWFWIHAAMRNDRRALDDWTLASSVAQELLGIDFELPHPKDLAYGAIIGRAKITGIVFPKGTLLHPSEPVPWHFADQFGFRVEGAVALESPVPCRGYQGFWGVPEATMQELRVAVNWEPPP